MAGSKRTANVVWEGDLMSGSGTITNTGSGAFGNLPVSWKARTEDSGGKTSPEELISAAIASCYSMAFSNALAGDGNAPTRLEVEATTVFSTEGGPKVASIDLDVRGTVDGIDQAAFEAAAKAAEQGCPVARSFAGNVPINIKATLA